MISKTFKTWDANNVVSPRSVRASRTPFIRVNKCGRVVLSRKLTDDIRLKAGDRISFIQGMEEPNEMFLYKVSHSSEAGIELKTNKGTTMLHFAGTAFAKVMAESKGVELPFSFRVSVAPEMPKVKGMPDVCFRCYINEIKPTKKPSK